MGADIKQAEAIWRSAWEKAVEDINLPKHHLLLNGYNVFYTTNGLGDDMLVHWQHETKTWLVENFDYRPHLYIKMHDDYTMIIAEFETDTDALKFKLRWA